MHNGIHEKISKGSIFSGLINSQRLLDNFFAALKIISPSKDERDINEFIKTRLEKLGVSLHNDETGKKIGGNCGNLIGFKPGNDKSRPPVFFSGHMDTVAVSGSIMPEIKKGKVINSDKTSILGGDNRVAIATIIEALEVIKENNIKTGDIYIIFTVGEETALLGAKHLDLKRVKAKYGFELDGEGDIGTIFNEAPFQDTMDFTITGRAVHAGVEPEKGINSIKVAADAISGLKIGRIDSDTTCNIGIISGGVATNIVPEITRVRAEARSLNAGKLEDVTSRIRQSFEKAADAAGAKLKSVVVREYNGYKIETDEMPVKIACKAIKNMGRKPAIVSTGGGSDINIFNAKGKHAVTLSAAMENLHSNKEYVKIKELEKLAVLILEICTIDIESID